jgi:hypothetical protein
MHRRRLAAVVSLSISVSVACSTTTYGPTGTSTAQKWLARNEGSEVRLLRVTGGDPEQVVIEARSPTDIRFRAKDARDIPLAGVRKVVAVNRPLGALEGALIGVVVGASLGLIRGSARDLSAYERSMDCTIVCSNADAARWEALFFSVPGLLLGAVAGAFVGHRDTLELR